MSDDEQQKKFTERPENQQPEPAAVADETPVGHWQYVGSGERQYPYLAGGPVTVRTWEVIQHAGIPAEDGCWRELELDEVAGYEVKDRDNAPVPAPVEDEIMRQQAARAADQQQ